MYFHSSYNISSSANYPGGSASLPIPQTPDLARVATAYASSSSSADQGAAKSIDGYINGYKENGSGDYTKEVSSDPHLEDSRS
jgi:hypothetical protein